MLSKVALFIAGVLTCSPQLASATESGTSSCVDISVPRQVVASYNGKWTELTSEQWQFLRGIYAMNPDTPPGLPFGDKAVLAEINGGAGGFVLFIDGNKACTPMRASSELLTLMHQVASGSINHQGAGI